jgi:peptidoglycan hydrolase-like protein with peptidoglycan-binding domain
MKTSCHRVLSRLLLAALCAAAPAPALAAELGPKQARELERLLAELSFDPGKIDGVVDGRTRTAIELYQAFAALPVDGAPSAALLAELREVARAFADMKAAPPTEEAEPAPSEETASGTTEGAPAPPATEVAQAPEAAGPEPEPVSEAPAAENPAAEAEADAGPAAEKPGAEPEPGVLAGSEAEGQGAQAPAADAPTKRRAAAGDPQAARVSTEAEPAAVARSGAGARAAATPAADVAAQAPAAAAPAAAPAEPPKPGKAGFDLDNMIARLVQRDGAAGGAAGGRPDRDLVLALQRQLARIGLDPGPLDGRVGARTTQAIESYQRARGLAVDGRPTQALLDRLARERPGAASPGAEATDDQTSQAVPSAPADTQFELRNAETAAKFPAVIAAAGVRAGDGYDAFKRGYAAAVAGDYDLAIEFYTRAIEGGDLALAHLADAFYNRANARSYKGAFDYAIADYSAAIVNNPEFPGAYYNRGFALEANGQRIRALADFMRARALGLQRLGVRSPDAPPPRP